VLFALCFPALAQQPTKVPRIGYLGSIPFSEFAARRNGFRQALRDLGYIEGKNIFIDWRSAEGKLDRLPGLAAELVRLKVDIIVSASPTTTLSIKDATSTIPIVMAQDADPVASGFAASLAQPGGNVTGLTTLLPEISGKRLEILRETVPRLVLVAVLGASTTPGTPQSLKETELAAEAFKVQLHYVDVLEAKDVELAFQDAAKWPRRCTSHFGRAFSSFTPNTDCRPCNKEPVSGDILLARICGRWGFDELWSKLY
jgi:putative ABC transport system substrate-binding protein